VIIAVAIALRTGGEMTKATLTTLDAMSDLVPKGKVIENGTPRGHVVLTGSANNEDNIVTH